ncbi:hypothetical protein MtrunA17_Chr6g0476631 [Medicago truncatula]|uniref:Uncharacterized protein n=1 Tax=Medicago truncatula TaxID=3880 RepID=A0A396HJS8_MEDTR|nr:hypothetical protein MtrunA17_Chr6g0476631 [Medicago truncatula]
MNEVTSLKNELVTMHEVFPEESDSSALSSPTKSSSEERTHETFHRSPQNAEDRDHMEVELQEEEENENRSLVAKMIKNHESIIQQKNEELNRIKNRILQEKKASSSKKRKELSIIQENIQIAIEKLDNLIKRNEKQGESLFNQKAIHEKETLPRKKLSSQEYEIDLGKVIQEQVHKCYLKEMMNELNESSERNVIKRKIREDINFIVFLETIKDINSNQEFLLAKEHFENEIQAIIEEDICMLVIRRSNEEMNKLMENFKFECTIREKLDHIVLEERTKLSSQEYEIDLEKLMQEHVQKGYLKEMMNELSESIERNKIKRKIREDTNFLVFFETIKYMNSNQDVLAKEALGDEIEGTLQEDISMLVFKKTIEEFNKMMTSCKVDNIIREQIDQIVFEETLSYFVNISSYDSIYHRKNTKIQENFSTMILNQVQKVQGQENLTIILLESLLSCFEAEENLMLSAHSEIKEHSKQLDLGSERGDLHEHEIFEDLLTGEEQTFSSLTSKVENVLQQLGISKALLKELGTSLGHSIRDSESFHQQMFAHEQEQLKLSSFESPIFEEFEATVYQKLEMFTLRYVLDLDSMLSQFDAFVQSVHRRLLSQD